MKFFLLLFFLFAGPGAEAMADPNFIPANSKGEIVHAEDERVDTTATLNQLEEREKEEDMKAAEEARIQAQEAADQQNYHYEIPKEQIQFQEKP